MTHVTIAAVTIFLHRHQTHHALDLHPIGAEESGILALREFSRKLRCYD